MPRDGIRHASMRDHRVSSPTCPGEPEPRSGTPEPQSEPGHEPAWVLRKTDPPARRPVPVPGNPKTRPAALSAESDPRSHVPFDCRAIQISVPSPPDRPPRHPTRIFDLRGRLRPAIHSSRCTALPTAPQHYAGPGSQQPDQRHRVVGRDAAGHPQGHPGHRRSHWWRLTRGRITNTMDAGKTQCPASPPAPR